MGTKKKFLQPGTLAAAVIVGCIGYLLACGVIAWLVDFRGINFLGIGSLLESIYPDYPIFWLQMFKEGSVTEVLQWVSLAAAMVLTGKLHLEHRRTQNRVFPGWFLLMCGLLLMFTEDTVNLRHGLAALIALGVLGINPFTQQWRASTEKNLLELGFYGLMALLMVGSFWYIVRNKMLAAKGKLVLLAGFGFYGAASVASATRNIGHWYQQAGALLLEALGWGERAMWSADSIVYGRFPLSFYFMDFFVEESVELLGAVFLLAAVLIFWGTRQGVKQL